MGEAQRRARKKEQEAKDPHRKVALRLENKRRFEEDALGKAGIPMSQVEVQGFKGRETVTLVDVRQLQSRCLFLDEGTHDVREMLDAQRREEQQRRRAVVSKSMQVSGSAPSFFESSYLER